MMNIQTSRAFRKKGSQRGVAALEFALVATLFLVILFGIVSYGGLFVVQQSLSRAAGEGARAFLNTKAAGSSEDPAEMAKLACQASVSWLDPAFERIECLPPAPCTGGAANCAEVSVVYRDYRGKPWIPSIALFDSWANWIPENLSASAYVQLPPS